jgi:hypothetical protein
MSALKKQQVPRPFAFAWIEREVGLLDEVVDALAVHGPKAQPIETPMRISALSI